MRRRLFAVEGIAADKFPNQTGGRDLVFYVGLLDEAEHLCDSQHFFIPGIIRSYFGKQIKDIALQHSQLIQRGAVEDDIRAFLEGVDPALFTLTHRIPHGEGALYRRAAGFVIANHSSQQAQEVCGDSRVVVHTQRDQRTDVELENVNPDNFYTAYYELPKEMVEGKTKVTIKFEADLGSFAGGIFDKISIVKEK